MRARFELTILAAAGVEKCQLKRKLGFGHVKRETRSAEREKQIRHSPFACLLNSLAALARRNFPMRRLLEPSFSHFFNAVLELPFPPDCRTLTL